MYSILIVEDEEIIRTNISRTIDWQSIGCFVCSECDSGEMALEEIARLKPDIVIADINLPGMSGIDMLEKARTQYMFQAIIVSGYSQFDYAKRAIGLSVVDYILKPIDEDVLVEAVKKATERIEQQRKLTNLDLDFAKGFTLDCLVASTRDPYLKKVFAAIAERYSEQISLESICSEIGLSNGYMSRKLKSEVGLSFLEILQRHRIEVAMRMIEADNSIKYYEIAEKVGFTSYKRFSVVFREVCGYTPTDISRKTNDR